MEDQYISEDQDDTFNPPSVSSRARNRTVMLTPDVTGQVRSLLQNSQSTDGAFQPPKKVSNENVTRSPNEGREIEATKIHSSPLFSSPATKEFKSDKRVEGTLELTKSKFLSGERRLEELGIGGILNVNEGYEDERKATKLNLENHLLRSENPVKRELGAVEPTSAPRVSSPRVSPPKATRGSKPKIIGFFVSYDQDEVGEVTEIRVGRWMVSSRGEGQEDVLLIPDSTISAMHAVIKVSPDGDVQILDQLSETGSGILRVGTGEELDASEAPVRVKHGDLVRFGTRYFVYCGVPKVQIEN